MKIITGLIIAILAVTLVGAWLLSVEDQLVYFPTRELVATPQAYGLEYQRVSLQAADGTQLMAWELYADEENAPWLIYFHGNGQNVSHYLPFTSQLVELGLNVLMLEYRGYGESEGSPSEAGLYQDAEAAYQHLETMSVPANDVILYGFSLGTGVATYLASQREIGALILEAGYTSLPDVARDTYRIVPTQLMRNRYPSKERISAIDAPILIMHARDDQVIGFHHGEKLFELAPEPKGFVELAGGHAALLGRDLPPHVQNALRGFITEHTHLPQHP